MARGVGGKIASNAVAISLHHVCGIFDGNTDDAVFCEPVTQAPGGVNVKLFSTFEDCHIEQLKNSFEYFTVDGNMLYVLTGRVEELSAIDCSDVLDRCSKSSTL